MADEKTGDAGNPQEGRTGLLYRLKAEWLEIVAAVLLALATVASAWCAYQAARWGSQESLEFNLATATRVHAAEADDLADTEKDIDVETFVIYVQAKLSGNEEEILYIKKHVFRDEFKAAVEAWEALDSAGNPDTPDTPFEMPDYLNENARESMRLEAEAVAYSEKAKEAIHNSDFYIMLTVLFASVLFFGGICTKFQTHGVKIAVLLMGIILFLSTLAVMAFQPVL